MTEGQGMRGMRHRRLCRIGLVDPGKSISIRYG
jgi:hypothetical protein